MRIGVPRESKDREYRVGLVPDGASALVAAGHEVLVQAGAGVGSGFPDAAYAAAGARLVSREEAFGEPELIVKVKEPQPDEVGLLRPGQILFTYLHLAAAPELCVELQKTGIIALAYETIRSADGGFPVLAPMSEVAGRLAPQIGAHLLLTENGGKGLLLGGVTGVPRGRVTILGAGVVGHNALRVACGLGAQVDLLDIDIRRLASVEDLYRGEVDTLHASPANIARSVRDCDLLIGAVYVSGRRAPTLVSEQMVREMEDGSVVVDVAVDQGGCIATVKATTHSEPTYVQHGVVHYGVANIPGAVPRTSTLALVQVTLPYIERIASEGVEHALTLDPGLARGANLWKGAVVCRGVAESLDLPYTPLEQCL